MRTSIDTGETLQDLIKSAGLTLSEFVSLMDVTRETIRLWSLGKRKPTLDKALLASKLLNCSIERFAMACKIQTWQHDNN